MLTYYYLMFIIQFMPDLFLGGGFIFYFYFFVNFLMNDVILSLCLLCQKDLFYRRNSLPVGVYIELLANM